MSRNDDEYKAQLAKYNADAQAHEVNAINEYINSRIVFVLEPQNGSAHAIGEKLLKIPPLKENRRKLFVHDSTLDGVLDWEKVKQRRLNVFAGSGLGIDKDRVESYFLENVFKPLNDSVAKETAEQDIVICFCRNDTAKKISHVESMRSAIATQLKRHQISIGTVEADTAETLLRHRRRTMRAFAATIEDKIKIASLRMTDVHFGKMKYLANGDTFFNKWPTPLLPISSM